MVKISNLPVEATEDDLVKFLQGLNIVELGIKDGACLVRVRSQKDVREALTFDLKYLYYKEVQVRRAPPDAAIPSSETEK